MRTVVAAAVLAVSLLASGAGAASAADDGGIQYGQESVHHAGLQGEDGEVGGFSATASFLAIN